MTENKPIESTISFNFDQKMYEDAGEMPTMYRALNLKPRKEHPFWIYEAIQAQPALVRQTLAEVPAAAEKIAEAYLSKGKKRILLSGIGASYHLAACSVHLLWNLAGVPTEFVESSEALLSDAVYDYPETLFFGFSASGNSLEAVEHTKLAHSAGALTVGLVNLDNTRLVHSSDISFVAAGGYGLIWDLTTRLAAMAYIATELGLRLGRPEKLIMEVRDALKQIPDQMAAVLKAIDERCRRIGAKIYANRAVVIPAAGNLLPVAWEAALRFEEMAHYPAKGRPVVDFLHGGVGYVAEDIATLIFAQPGKTADYSLRLARVTQTLKTPCFAVVDENDQEISALADEVVRIPHIHPFLRPMLYLMPAQLITYYTEVARPGGNPDAQRTDHPKWARAFDVAYPPKSH